MDEIIEQGIGQEETTDGFMQGFDDGESVTVAADQPTASEGAEESKADETEKAPQDGGDADAGDSGKTITQSAQEEEPAKETENPVKTYHIKHLDKEFDVDGTEENIVRAFQKEQDYERIRQKYDESKPVMEMFTQFAAAAGMSVADYVKTIRTEAKKASGMDETQAKKSVELEDREAAISAAEAAKQEASKAQQAAASAEEARQAKIRSGVEEFSRAFPKIYQQAKTDPKVIPQSVWNDVNAGLSLAAAYGKYAAANAEKAAAEKAATAVKNSKNAARSTGSMQSAGNDGAGKDPFLDAFSNG